MEAETGPVRYLAQFLGGDEADVEKTIRLLILVIAGVFDPPRGPSRLPLKLGPAPMGLRREIECHVMAITFPE
jgi:hypothetical protein